jgi:putative spermidine/putrescine transport system permease protein
MMARRAGPYSGTVWFAAALSGLFLVLPVVIIVYYAFSPTGLIAFPPPALTLRWFVSFFASTSFRSALENSLLIAAVVTPVTLAIAVPTAVALVRRQFRGRALLNALVLSPLVIPGVISGVAFLNLFTVLGLSSGFWRIVFAMICFTLPFAVRALVATLHGLDPSLEEAARNLGGRPWQAFLSVTLPQLRPGLLAGALFVFVESIDNFSIAVFLTDSRTSTLPVEAFGYIRDFDDPTVAALATVLIVQSLFLVFILQRLIGMDRFLDLHQ